MDREFLRRALQAELSKTIDEIRALGFSVKINELAKLVLVDLVDVEDRVEVADEKCETKRLVPVEDVCVECKNKPIFVKALKLCQACYKRQHRARTPILCKVCNLNRVYYKTKSLCESCWKESKKEPLQLPVPPEALPKLDLTGT